MVDKKDDSLKIVGVVMYIIEGNIGAGKSTFMHILNKHLPILKTILEPIEVWNCKNSGQSLLQHFNADPKRWSFTMETFTMMSRVREYLRDKALKNKFIVVERSVYSGHYVFSLNGYKQGFMTKKEWKIYLEFFNYLINDDFMHPEGFIYLRVDPEVAYERIKKRMRASEDLIPIEYLRQIHERHDEFLLKKIELKNDIANVPVLVLDCNQDFENDETFSKELADRVAAFIGVYGKQEKHISIEEGQLL